MTKNVLSGKTAEVAGVKELVLKLEALKSLSASKEAYDVVGRAAKIGQFEVESAIKEENWPHETFECVFTYDKPGKSVEVSALLGIVKRGRDRPYAAGYAEWGKRIGKLVGESLATMYEYGTTRFPGRPAFRRALTATKAAMVEEMRSGFEKILAEHAAK